jgi:hypothetical protein
LCFWIELMIAAPAAVMNVGRFSAAQSRLAVVVTDELWKRGAT